MDKTNEPSAYPRLSAEDRALMPKRASLRAQLRHMDRNDAEAMEDLEAMRGDGYTPAERVQAWEGR